MSKRELQLFSTPPHPCSYLDDRSATNTFLDPAFQPSPTTYGYLLNSGFRRSGNHVYRPSCGRCKCCQSVRVSSARFQPNRNQSRCWKRNQDLEVSVQPAGFSNEYFDLYTRYLTLRHAEGGMDHPTEESFKTFLFADWSTTWFLEFRSKGRLLCVAVSDEVPEGYSAVYTFFDPLEGKRSLGTYAILWQIALARAEQRPWTYLGYLIEESEKMRYKKNFKPLEVFHDNQWVNF